MTLCPPSPVGIPPLPRDTRKLSKRLEQCKGPQEVFMLNHCNQPFSRRMWVRTALCLQVPEYLQSRGGSALGLSDPPEAQSRAGVFCFFFPPVSKIDNN